MATINFLYRSTKANSNLIVRLLFRENGKDYVIGAKTKLDIEKDYWINKHTINKPRDIEIANKQVNTNSELNKIKNHILKAFSNRTTNSINKEWLTKQIEHYYNPPTVHEELPKELLSYIDSYTDKNKFKKQTLKNYNTVKNLLIRYETFSNETIQINNVNEKFKNKFEDYCLSQGYAPNTIAKAFSVVRTICQDAKYNGIEVSYQLEKVRYKYVKAEMIYLTFEELEKIEKVELNDSLSNARDWLIISCFTGQRISDFMKFTKEQIRAEKGKSLLEFTQYKTNKIMTIPIHKKVELILNKRNGNFPKAISDQKYNVFIKAVCKKAGLTQKEKGTLLKETKEGSKQYRKQSGVYPKHELVSSHIGRRSFATNHYGQIPTNFLIYITGHSTESMFLNYIGKSNKDLALEVANYF